VKARNEGNQAPKLEIKEGNTIAISVARNAFCLSSAGGYLTIAHILWAKPNPPVAMLSPTLTVNSAQTRIITLSLFHAHKSHAFQTISRPL